MLHSDSNGYTNLPDVVQPSHSPTESNKGQSPSSKDGGSDVSTGRGEHWTWAGDSGGAQRYCGGRAEHLGATWFWGDLGPTNKSRRSAIS